MGITWMCEILIIMLFIVLATVPLEAVLVTVELLARKRVHRRNRDRISKDHSIPMPLHPSRKIYESEIYTQLVGWILGILYWIICTTYLVKESLVVVDYYFEYLLSQDVDTAE